MSKTYLEKLQRIDQILKKGKDHFMHFDLLLNKKRKLLIAASFDSFYYHEFFILFTGVKNDESCKSLGDAAHSRWLTISNDGFDAQTKLQRTKLGGIDLVLNHKDIFYSFPEKPFYTGLGIDKTNEANYTLLDLTAVIDLCFALEDTLTLE